LGVITTLGSANAGVIGVALVLGSVALVLDGAALDLNDLVDDAGEDKRPRGAGGRDEVCDDVCDDSDVT
jgi:hypothetical protein